jgi:acetyltransferase
MQHYLRPLLSPTSVAMVGASERPGSVGRTAFENLISGGFKGALHAVNPRHATVLGHPAVPTLSSIGAPVELAVVATPAVAVAGVLEDGAAVGLAVNGSAWSAPARSASFARTSASTRRSARRPRGRDASRW